ncbi:hypothetical protein GCM10020295_10190 [Streptomyces cinereospinus]
MTVRLHWFLPTGGDGRTLVDRHAYARNDTGAAGAARGVRAPRLDYLAQIAKAAEQLGFEAVLTPTGTWCEDAWLTTVALAQHTERLKFLVAFRPGVISPTLAAQMAATHQRLTGGGCCSTSSPAATPPSSAASATTSPTTSGTPARTSSCRSCAGCGRAVRTTSGAPTTTCGAG